MALATSPQEPELPKEARFEPKHTCAWHWSALPPQWAPLGPASRLVERGNIAISAPTVFPTVDSSSYAREVASRLLKLGTFVKSMQEPKGQEVRQQSKKRAVISPHSSPQEPAIMELAKLVHSAEQCNSIFLLVEATSSYYLLNLTIWSNYTWPA